MTRYAADYKTGPDCLGGTVYGETRAEVERSAQSFREAGFSVGEAYEVAPDPLEEECVITYLDESGRRVREVTTGSRFSREQRARDLRFLKGLRIELA